MKTFKKMTYKISILIGICWITAFSSLNLFAAETNHVPTRINADKLECDYEEGIVYLRGSVVVRDNKGILKADNATVYFGDSKKKGGDSIDSASNVGSFSRVVAVGNVRMSSDNKAIVVISEKAVWNKKENKITLTGGSPMVKRGSSYIKAKRIVYDLTTQKCEWYPDPVIVFSVEDSEKTKFFE
ncbi:hypothetical protein KAH27_02885 [bacterium]|nr:hypothetical protein [bacterium]